MYAVKIRAGKPSTMVPGLHPQMEYVDESVYCLAGWRDASLVICLLIRFFAMLFCSLSHIQKVPGATQSSQSQETPRRVLFAAKWFRRHGVQ